MNIGFVHLVFLSPECATGTAVHRVDTMYMDLTMMKRRSSPVVRNRKLAYHAAGPSSIHGLGGENYRCKNLALYIGDCESLCLSDEVPSIWCLCQRKENIPHRG